MVGRQSRPRGREGEYEAFFVAHYSSLVRTVTVITGDGELADEAVQDAFYRAYARWGRIRRYEAPAAWVRRVAINRARDLGRSARRRANTEQRALSLSPTAGIDVEGQVGGELNSLLAHVSPSQRAALALHYVDDMSVADIADALDMAQGTVKFHLHRGRETLRQVLRDQAPPASRCSSKRRGKTRTRA